MTTAIKRRRGTTSQHSTFTGLEGELTIDTTKDTVVVHDGATAGGFPLLREDLANNTNIASISTTQTFTNKTIALGSNTVSGTLAEFNTAVTDADFASIAGTETLTNKTLTSPVISGGSINGTTIGASTASTGAFTSLSASGAFSANGGATLGDASGDALTINSSAVSIPNGLNFDSNTLVIDAANNNVGIGTSSTPYKLNVAGSIYAYNTSAAFLSQDTTGGAWFANAQAGNYVITQSGVSERMRIDSSGNVGIGTSSPASKLHAQRSDDGVIATFRGPSFAQLEIGIQSGNLVYDSGNGNATHIWQTNTTERMRIDASGNLLVGTTSSSGAKFDLVGSNEIAAFKNTSGTGNFRFLSSGGTTIGYIQWSGSATSYVTSSDYRLKENIAPMTGALAKVSALKPVTYNWKSDGSDGQGFIAHELQEVVPECVTGTKDAVDKDGKPIYQGIDTSFLVATLTAAIQELKAEVDALKAQINQ